MIVVGQLYRSINSNIYQYDISITTAIGCVLKVGLLECEVNKIDSLIKVVY